jgi:hypothetical protein
MVLIHIVLTHIGHAKLKPIYSFARRSPSFGHLELRSIFHSAAKAVAASPKARLRRLVASICKGKDLRSTRDEPAPSQSMASD